MWFLRGAYASLRGAGFAYRAMVSFCFRLWHEALEPQTTNITTNQGKMNEFELLPTSVCTKPTRCRPKQAYANAYATYAIYNMSCGVPTLSIVLHPFKKNYSFGGNFPYNSHYF